MRKKKILQALCILGIFSATILSGCGSSASNNTGNNASTKDTNSTAATGTNDSTNTTAPKDDAKPVKLKLGMWEAKTDIEFWTEKVKEYSKIKPNVSIEVETIPDNSGQYLKVRLAADDLPDLMYLKPAHFQIYKNSLLPLDELKAAKSNKFPGVIDGQTLGLPLVSFSEYVYYHPSIFQELNLTIPQTIDEFVNVLEKIKESKKYIPLALGGKDDWTFYPFSEFGPHVLSKDEQYQANLANQAEPFGPGSTFETVANLIKKIADDKLAGPDALGIGYDQATQLFQSKQAAIIALGQWYYADHLAKVGNEDDLAAFPMPWRTSASDPLPNMTLADQYVSISKNSENADEAKAFLEWMFSPEVYQPYINTLKNTSTVEGVTSDLPFFNKSNQEAPFTPFIYDATNERFAKVKAAAQYDEKKTAADIFSGKKIEDVEKALNASWKKAVESVK
ncbi:raffinose/stachyose/melibiose transport system substrate-binding protein [Paenibacillus catalpae]|uniref:Raffinose/stachyose/melibiose transport system substrate-binding protein n=1 Tax=Paenibacillus catalpae TaxID=1045775 RepID=A0A1I1SXM2_9BACL|nr:extracellular solute-binding protein [Paenibacillus catalpae]SFD48683.1 raffinose/stachyose/melibiose transport system substrate-binding protein [Paenibacillus catalpae]